MLPYVSEISELELSPSSFIHIEELTSHILSQAHPKPHTIKSLDWNFP